MNQLLTGRIIFLVNKLEITNGVSSHLYYLLQEMGEFARNNIVLIAGGGSVVYKYERLVKRVIVDTDIRHETRSSIGFVRGVFRLRKFIKKYKPAIIHSHHFYAANMAAYARIGKTISTIQTIHGNIPPIGFFNHYRADHYILVSNHLLEQLKRESRLVSHSVIPSPFPFPALPPKNESHSGLKFLFAGRLVAEKNLALFVKTAESICTEVSDVSFVIAGDGPMRDLALKASENQGIRYLGEVDNLGELLSDFDVIVNCSIATEGFPTILIQAAAWAKCVISSKFEGYSDFLTEDNSFLYESDNESDFETIIREIIKNPEMMKIKGKQIFDDFKDSFRVDKVAEKTISLYEKMAE